ncbi:MAG: MtrB/PioB family decaheme-associated outer membrane protein [Deltaproteobacteria bacterium]|nr:MtrB/PioB family decaheme-associated outer membrane protein [Deltaproteobacteria bacterium]
MIRGKIACAAAALLLSLALFAGTAQAEAGAGIGGAAGLLDIGVQQKKVNGSSEKFEEYRDVRNGFLVNDASIRLEQDASRYFLEVKIKNPAQENEYYSLTGGKHGIYKYNLFYDSIPHNFSDGVLLFNGAGTNRLSIADNVQSALQAVEQTRVERGNVITDTTGEDASAQSIVRGLYAQANPFTFKLKREKAGFSLECNVSEDVKTWAKVTNEKRTGARVITAGTYERYAQGSGLAHTADLFLVSGADLAEPIDFRTTTVSLGAGVYKRSWLADFEYSFTDFNNRNAALIWDNPFRITDATATSSAGASAASGDNGFERGRFARGQLSLSPDSKSHDFTASGAVDLPHRGRFTGTVSYGWITQDSPFLPYTLNSALNGLAFAGAPGALGIDVTNAGSLPKSNLDGDVKTLSGSFVVTAKPTHSLKTTLKYRYYDYKNESDEIRFPGYAGFGESYWRLIKNDTNTTDAAVFNEPLSFTRQTAGLSLDYHASKPLALLFDAGWEGWKREKLRIDSTTEYSAGAGFLYKAAKNASLKAGYKYAKRTVDGYKNGDNAANPEAIGLRNFDWADRVRHKTDARFQYDPSETLSLGLSGQYMRDKLAQDSRFGLKKVENVAGGLDVSYTPSERIAFSLNYLREYRKSRMNSGAKDDAFDIGTTTDNEATLFGNFNPLNYWNTDIKETTDTVGVGAKIQILPDKLTLDTSYNLSYSKADYNTFNPNRDLAVANGFAAGAKLTNAVAQSWPTVVNRLHEVKANLSYKWFANLTVGVGYLFEWYKLDDFAWNNMNPYMAGLTAENSTKFVFADATYNKYEAHVGQIYMVYKF